MTLNKNKLKRDFQDACNAYLKAFCEKHGYDYEGTYWAGGDVGGMVLCGDQCVSIDTIRTDIDMDAPEEEFLKWYDYITEVGFYNLPAMNYEHWLKGAPRIPRESIENIKARKQELDDLIKEADDLYKGFD